MYNCTAIRILNHHVVTELEENFPACTGFETALRIFSYMLPTKYQIQINSKDTTPTRFEASTIYMHFILLVWLV